MNIIHLMNQDQLDKIIRDSHKQTIILFKHSTRCSISNMALNRITSNWDLDENISFYFLDLLKYRELSNQIENIFNIKHESPQMLLIREGKCFYTVSHNAISMAELKRKIIVN